MRQPATIIITPSASQPWYGTAAEGDRYTRQQLYHMVQRGMNPATAEAITVKREATSKEMWWPIGEAPPIFEFDCPIISRRRDGKLNVLTPSGDVKAVLDDGWVVAARRKRKSMGWG